MAMFSLKLTPKQIKDAGELEKELNEFYRKRNDEIRTLYATGTWTLQELANKYGLTRQRISKIVNQE